MAALSKTWFPRVGVTDPDARRRVAVIDEAGTATGRDPS